MDLTTIVLAGGVVLALLIVGAYGALIYIVWALVGNVNNTLRLAWATLTTLEQMLYYVRNDISKMRQHQDRFFGIYGYINPAYRRREQEEDAAERSPIEREPDI